MNVTVKRNPAQSKYETARVQITIDGIGVLYGHTLRPTKDGSDEWLAPPSIYGKKGWSAVVPLNGAFRQKITDVVKTMADGDEQSFDYSVPDAALGVYIYPFEGSKNVLAMGALTLKDLFSVSGCVYKIDPKTNQARLYMPSWYNSGSGTSGSYFLLDKSLYARVQNASRDAYKAKKK